MRGHQLQAALSAEFGERGTAGSCVFAQDQGTGLVFKIVAVETEHHDDHSATTWLKIEDY